MFVPRTFIVAGIALIAISLGASGHGLWWLIGLVWALGWTHHGRRACHVRPGRHGQRHDEGHDERHDQRHEQAGSTTAPAAQPAGAPDPTHDRHEAFPVR